jgi:hypothetical protein
MGFEEFIFHRLNVTFSDDYFSVINFVIVVVWSFKSAIVSGVQSAG